MRRLSQQPIDSTASFLAPTWSVAESLPSAATIKPQHRPLHSQVATLLVERKQLLATFETLSAENARVWADATTTKASLDDLTFEHDATMLTKHELETKLDSATDVLGIVSSGAMETVQLNRSMRTEMERLDLKCRALAGRLALQNEQAQRESTLAQEARKSCAVERSIWMAEIAQNDDELKGVSTQLDESLHEQLWLRVQLAKAVEAAEELKQDVGREVTENAQLASVVRQSRTEARTAVVERDDLAQQLAASQHEAASLRRELAASRVRCDALKGRAAQCDAARVDAMVIAARADALLSASYEGSTRASESHEALRRHLDEATRTLRTGAQVAERMRTTHSEAERMSHVERTWAGVMDAGQRTLSGLRDGFDVSLTCHGSASAQALPHRAAMPANVASPTEYACAGPEVTPRTAMTTTMAMAMAGGRSGRMASGGSGTARSPPSCSMGEAEGGASDGGVLAAVDSGWSLAVAANAYAAASHALAHAATARVTAAEAAFDPHRPPLGPARTPPPPNHQLRVPTLAAAAWGSHGAASR